MDTDGKLALDAGRRLRRTARWRRAVFFALTLLTAAAATAMMGDILAANGLTGLKRAGLVLFYILFVWITGAFWTAFAGLIVRWRGGDRAALNPEELAGRPLAGTRRGDATLNSCVEKDSPMSSAELAKTA